MSPLVTGELSSLIVIFKPSFCNLTDNSPASLKVVISFVAIDLRSICVILYLFKRDII